jgi:DNA invertase Pin-like site-specific DNA recombinase
MGRPPLQIRVTEILDLTTAVGRAIARLLAIFTEFDREILRERTPVGLANVRQNCKRLGLPATAAKHAAEVRKLYGPGITKAEIARPLQIGRLDSPPYAGFWADLFPGEIGGRCSSV